MLAWGRAVAEDSAMRKSPGLFAWTVWSVGAIGFFCAFFQRVGPSIMVGELMADFGVSAALLGNLSALYFYAYASLQIPIGVMVDRWGPRRLMTIAWLLAGTGSLLFAAADTLEAAYLGRFLIGVGSAFFFVCSLKIAAVWFPVERFALMGGLTLMAGMAGGVGGQAPTAWTVGVYGWRPTLAAAGIFAFVFAVVCWTVVRDRPGGGRRDLRSHAAPHLLAGLFSALRQPQTWLLAAAASTMSATLLAFAALWGVPYMMAEYGLSRPLAAGSISLMLIGWAVGSPAIGWLSDRVGSRRYPVIAVAVLSAVSFSALIFLRPMPLFLAEGLLFFNGVVSGGMVVLLAAARDSNSAEASGSAVSFVNTAIIFSGALLQPVIGWLLDLNWDGRMEAGARVYSVDAFNTAFLTLVAANVLAIVLCLFVRDSKHRPKES